MMTQNPMRSMQPRTRRQMHLHRSILAVTLLASQTHHDVDALVGSNHSPLRSSSINFQPTNRRSSSLTFLSSIGDPERNSDRERKSKDASNNKRRRRRNSNNGKYNRQRRYTATDTTKQDSQNDRKEEKIRTSGNNSLKQFSSGPTNIIMQQPESKLSNTTVDSLKKRVVQLETLVSSQMSEIQKLRREMEDMSKTVQGVSNFVEQLQAFVHEDDELSGNIGSAKQKEMSVPDNTNQQPMFDDDYEIFGIAPTTIKDAADSAGQSILSAILAGKHRMLVDVRDAELTRDQTLLVEFIELAILPVAAGLQGLDTYSNRVKIIFPTVEDLLGYRKSMALAAPEVIALSTLGFDPIEEKDNLIVIVAPSPDDVAGCELMHKLLERTGSDSNRPIQRPVVLLNHHMMPVDTGNVGKFTVVYHLRLLSVQYMTGDITPEYVSETDDNDVGKSEKGEGDSALEAAMTHAREIGVHQVLLSSAVMFNVNAVFLIVIPLFF